MPSPAPLTDDDIDAVCEALLAFYASPMACWRLSGDRFGAHKRHTLTALSQMQAATARLNPAYQAADQPAVRYVDQALADALSQRCVGRSPRLTAAILRTAFLIRRWH